MEIRKTDRGLIIYIYFKDLSEECRAKIEEYVKSEIKRRVLETIPIAIIRL